MTDLIAAGFVPTQQVTETGGVYTFNNTNISASFQSDPPEVPLPGALPLFATGLGALGLLGWYRKKKAAALAA